MCDKNSYKSNAAPRMTASASFLFVFITFTYDLLGIIEASHILLKGLPRTATSGDLRRAVMLAGLQGVTKGKLAHTKPLLKVEIYFFVKYLLFTSGSHLLGKPF